MKEFSTYGIKGALYTIHQNYYTQLCKLDDEETKKIEIAAVGAGLRCGFNHTSKLKVMKLKEAMTEQDSSKWK